MDLSRIPEPYRSKIAQQLEALPPELRGRLEEKLAKLPLNQLTSTLERNSALLQKLAAQPVNKHQQGRQGLSTVASKTGSLTGQAPKPQSVFDPHDHYNNTIHRGDRESPPLFVIMFLVACLAVALQAFGLLGP